LDPDTEVDKPKYKAYRKAFRTELVFPEPGQPDHDPAITSLKSTWEFCSKPVHGSIFGIANFIGNAPRNGAAKTIAFFDLPNDSLQSMFFYVVRTHLTLLELFAPVIEQYMDDTEPSRKEFKYVSEKAGRNLDKWIPNIKALNAARNAKKTSTPNG
jgi:hypothetical protein